MENKKKIKEAQKLIVAEIEKENKLLLDFFKNYCKEHDTKAVPIFIIDYAFRTTLENYKKGAGT